MIRNEDGTPYSLGEMALWDPQNPEHLLHDEIDRELIRMSGSPVLYYKYVPSRVEGNIYSEERDKIFSPTPVCVFAVWEPPKPLQDLGYWGIDSPDDVAMAFNRNEFVELVGELPTTGSLLMTMYDREWWEITKASGNSPDDKDQLIWGKHRVAVLARKYQPSATDSSPDGRGRATASQTGHASNIAVR